MHKLVVDTAAFVGGRKIKVLQMKSQSSAFVSGEVIIWQGGGGCPLGLLSVCHWCK